MRILYVSYFFPPHRAVGSVRAWRFANALHDLGHDVEVLTSEVAPEVADNGRFDVQNVRFTIHRRARFEALAGKAKSALRKQLHARATDHKREGSGSLSWMRTIAELVEAESSWNVDLVEFLATKNLAKFDVILISGRPFASFLPFVFWPRLANKIILDMRDPWSQLAPADERRQALLRIERQLFERVDKVLLTSAAATKRYAELFPRERDKFEMVRNSAQSLAEDWSTSGFELVYGGVLYNRDLKPLLRAFKRFQEHDCPQATLTLAGRIEVENLSNDLMEALGDSVTVHGFLPFEEFKQILTRACAMLVPIGDYDLCIPGKFYECLEYGKPILFLGNKEHELTDIIEHDLGVGAAAESHDEEQILAALRRLYGQIIPALREEGVEAVRAEPFLLAGRVRQVDNIIRNVCEEGL